MPTVLQFRRGTTSQNNSFTGTAGELSVDTTLDTIRVHDGSTAGGVELTQNVAAQTLTNKTISGSSNTLSNIGNSSLTNSGNYSFRWFYFYCYSFRWHYYFCWYSK